VVFHGRRQPAAEGFHSLLAHAVGWIYDSAFRHVCGKIDLTLLLEGGGADRSIAAIVAMNSFLRDLLTQ
jgi:hypothetical protein